MLVDHPNIIRYFESYEDDRYIHIVQELCLGGDLLDRFAYSAPFSEETVSRLYKKIFSAVNHIHSIYICHRDIKPENFLFTTKDPDAEVKMIDFGMSNKFGHGSEELSTMVGTPNYLAPEVLSARYGKECDVWSLGVMLYYLLSGTLPFEGQNIGETFKRISLAEFDFSKPEWLNYSSEVKDLISRMLVSDPSRRISLPTALSHKWFFESASSRRSSIEVPHTVLTSITKYKPPAKLQQEAMRVMVKYLSAKDIEELDAAFKALDKESTGFITHQNLEKAMMKAGVCLSTSELKEIVESIDVLQQGGIKYSNFLMATLDRKKFLTEEVMYMAFKHMDMDNDGFITVKDLKFVIEGSGETVSEEEVQEIIGEFASEGHMQISFEEFRRMMEGENHTEYEKAQNPGIVIPSSVHSRRTSLKQRMSVISEGFV